MRHFIKSIILVVVIACVYAGLLYVIPELNRVMRLKHYIFIPASFESQESFNFTPQQHAGYRYFTENIDSDLRWLATQWLGTSSEEVQITTTFESYGFNKRVEGRSIEFQRSFTQDEAEIVFYEQLNGKRGFELSNYPQLIDSGWSNDTFQEYIDPPTILPSATAILKKVDGLYQVAVFRNELLVFKKSPQKALQGTVQQVIQCPCKMRYSIFLSDFISQTAHPRQ